MLIFKNILRYKRGGVQVNRVLRYTLYEFVNNKHGMNSIFIFEMVYFKSSSFLVLESIRSEFENKFGVDVNKYNVYLKLLSVLLVLGHIVRGDIVRWVNVRPPLNRQFIYDVLNVLQYCPKCGCKYMMMEHCIFLFDL